jgi:hypothetical protein
MAPLKLCLRKSLISCSSFGVRSTVIIEGTIPKACSPKKESGSVENIYLSMVSLLKAMASGSERC